VTAIAVDAIATLVAAARAVAGRRGLIDDPFAEPLVHAAGVDFFTRVATGELAVTELRDGGGLSRLTGLFAARTRFFDNFLADALRAGVRQAVILGSGLDARPYRLWWPAGVTVYELDRPRVIEMKTRTMRALGVTPAVDRRAVGIDWREQWPMALRQIGFDATQPAAWIAEGLLTGFSAADATDRLLDGVTALSAAGSRFAADYLAQRNSPSAGQQRALAQCWQDDGLDVDPTELTCPGGHNDAGRYLGGHGWATLEVSQAELFAVTGLPDLRRHHPADAAVSDCYVNATRT
jgi:methyltransferase (TIGR00027 family)